MSPFTIGPGGDTVGPGGGSVGPAVASALSAVEDPASAEDRLFWVAGRISDQIDSGIRSFFPTELPPVGGAASTVGTYTTSFHAKAPLRDPLTYCGGWKEPRIRSFNPVTWVASDWLTGEFSPQTYGIVRADTDRAIRSLIEEHARYQIGAERWLLWYSSEQRRARLEPTLLHYGLVVESDGETLYGDSETIADVIGRTYALYRRDKLVPGWLFNRTDFPGLPDDSMLEMGPQIVGGLKSDEWKTNPGGMVDHIDMGDYVLNGQTVRFLLSAGHACYQGGYINSYQGDNGGTPPIPTRIPWTDNEATWPGKTSGWAWTDLVPTGELYVDRNGKWLTGMALRGQRRLDFLNGRKVFSNMWGFDSIGNGRGAQVTDGPILMGYLLINWILNTYTGGPLQTTSPQIESYPGGPLQDLVDRDSILQASADGLQYDSRGLQGGLVIAPGGRPQSAREVLRDGAMSFLLQFYKEYGTYGCRMWTRDRTKLYGANTTTIDGRREVMNFKYKLRTDAIYNNQPAEAAMNYRTGKCDLYGQLGNGVNDDRARASFRRLDALPADILRLTYIADATSGLAVAQEHINWRSTPMNVATWQEPFAGMKRKVTSGWPLSHPNGPGPRGYVDNAFRIEKRTLDPNTGLVSIEATDVEPMLPPLTAPGARPTIFTGSAAVGTGGPSTFTPGG